MNKYLPLVVIAAVALAIGAGVALTGKNDDNRQSTGSSTGQQVIPGDGGSSSTVTDQQATVTDEVEIEDQAFIPANISVKKGTTVTWTNKDDVDHTVTAKSGNGPDSQQLGRDDSYSFTFNEAGEFSYRCDFHPSMTGKVTVT